MGSKNWLQRHDGLTWGVFRSICTCEQSVCTYVNTHLLCSQVQVELKTPHVTIRNVVLNSFKPS